MIVPLADTIPAEILVFEGLVFWLVIEEAVMLKSFPANTKAEDEFVKEAALMVNLSPDCKVPELVIAPVVVAFKVDPEMIFLELLRLDKFKTKLPLD